MMFLQCVCTGLIWMPVSRAWLPLLRPTTEVDL